MNILILILVVSGITILFASIYSFLAYRAMEQAKARATWLNKELERTDSHIEVVEIWSDEHMERNDRDLANAILEKVGTDLSVDESTEAKRLRAFLVKIRHRDEHGELNAPRDFGVAWFACLQVQDQEPASELAQLFKVLNDAWSATREGRPQIRDSDQRIALKTIATTLVQTGTSP